MLFLALQSDLWWTKWSLVDKVTFGGQSDLWWTKWPLVGTKQYIIELIELSRDNYYYYYEYSIILLQTLHCISIHGQIILQSIIHVTQLSMSLKLGKTIFLKQFKEYSGTSDEGLSEKGTTSLQRTLSKSPTVYFCMKLMHFDFWKEDNLSIRNKMAGPKASFTQRFHCTM